MKRRLGPGMVVKDKTAQMPVVKDETTQT